MWIFGKKANKQSSKTEVPPELQSYYYARQARIAKYRLILSVLILVILIVGGVFGGLWLHSRATSTNHLQISSNQSSNKTNSESNTKSNKNNNSIPVPAPKTTTPAPTSQTPPVSTMPNTGPGTEMLIIVGGAGLLGAIFYHIRQIRAVRQ